MNTETECDVAIIGGGINGAGIARDLSGRGLKVLLAEKADLGGGTSSASTKLIHGGLRYLEHYEFRLVREALIEREVLLRAAPHIIWPLRIVLPHMGDVRPAWLVRLGLFIYDHLGGRKVLPPTRRIGLDRDALGAPLRPGLTHGFEYSDCWVDDSRLVVLNARDAADRGAEICTRCEVTGARREGAGWRLDLADGVDGVRSVRARALVNAAGPWVDGVLAGALGRNAPPKVRLVKGSHIVVRKLFDHDRAYMFQNPDRRIIFAIPYERDYTLIGTTDEEYEGRPEDVAISDTEIDYLIAAAGSCFRAPLSRDDVVRTYSGIRPLYDDGASAAQEATRDYVLECDDEDGAAPLLSVFGGKITTFRKLAEAACKRLAPYFPEAGGNWTAAATLPGGALPGADFAAWFELLAGRFDWLDRPVLLRLARAYGTEVEQILGDARSRAELGIDFGGGLTEAEVRYLCEREWARCADDVLWRRSKLGLHVPGGTEDALAGWFERRCVSRRDVA